MIQLGISDHFGIFALTASNKAKKGRQDHLMIAYHDFKSFDESKFLDDVDSAPWSLIDIYYEINDKVDIFYQLINQSLDWHAPKRQKEYVKSPTPWITSQVIECIRQKSHALQLFLRNKTDQAWVFYKQMRNKSTESIKASKREYFTSVNDNKDNLKAMWKAMKKLLPSKKAKIPGSIDYQGQTYTSSQEIANCYNSFFTTIAKDLTAHLPPLEFNITNKLTPHILKLPTVNAQTVKRIISKLKNSKRIGLDNVSMNTIKH